MGTRPPPTRQRERVKTSTFANRKGRISASALAHITALASLSPARTWPRRFLNFLSAGRESRWSASQSSFQTAGTRVRPASSSGRSGAERQCAEAHRGATSTQCRPGQQESGRKHDERPHFPAQNRFESPAGISGIAIVAAHALLGRIKVRKWHDDGPKSLLLPVKLANFNLASFSRMNVCNASQRNFLSKHR